MSLLIPQSECAEDPLAKERRERTEQQFDKKHGVVKRKFELDGRIVRKHANQFRFRDGEGHKEGSDTLKVLLEVLAAENAYKRPGKSDEPNPDRAIPNARLPVASSSTSTVPPAQGPPPPTLRRSTRIRRPVQRFDPSPA
ncbi:hypothetical protein ANCDUO_01396 [Ancylostoma duodenale]|uniref:Uncharacterized protein n=1 Tax=Ancylostoma duodenale TaxID=51022 RepID=A0A0C2DE97_9BILA|nr:hypothetical protein ANCDUO_01396 [Ancylostoma duodenale]